MSDRINLTELWRKYIQRAHEGNGTGCRCCDLVDDNVLDALVEAVEAARAVKARDDNTTLPLRPALERMYEKLARFSFGNTHSPDDHASDQAARRYENHLEQIKDHGP